MTSWQLKQNSRLRRQASTLSESRWNGALPGTRARRELLSVRHGSIACSCGVAGWCLVSDRGSSCSAWSTEARFVTERCQRMAWVRLVVCWQRRRVTQSVGRRCCCCAWLCVNRFQKRMQHGYYINYSRLRRTTIETRLMAGASSFLTDRRPRWWQTLGRARDPPAPRRA